MIPLMEKEIVNKHRWLSEEDFLDTIAVAQTMPGIFAMNVATNVGWRKCGFIGAVVSVLGNIMMPVTIILLLAGGLRYLSDNKIVESVFMGIRPAVVALIAAPVFRMSKNAGINKYNFWIPVAAALTVWLLKVSPIWIILATIAGGTACTLTKKQREEKKQ